MLCSDLVLTNITSPDVDSVNANLADILHLPHISTNMFDLEKVERTIKECHCFMCLIDNIQVSTAQKYQNINKYVVKQIRNYSRNFSDNIVMIWLSKLNNGVLLLIKPGV